MNHIKQLADAFAAGVAFARSASLAMDAAEEDKGFWRTIRGRKIHFGPDGKATNAPDWFNPNKIKLSPKAQEAVEGSKIKDFRDEFKEVHGKPLDARTIYGEFSSLEKEIKDLETKNEYSRDQLRAKIKNDAKSIRNAAESVKGEARDIADSVADALDVAQNYLDKGNGADLNRLYAVSRMAAEVVQNGLTGISDYDGNRVKQKEQLDSLRETADKLHDHIETAQLIGQNDLKASAVDKDLKETAKRLKETKSITKLRQTLHAEGLSASEINRVVEARTRIIDALADAQAKNKILNQEIKDQLTKGNISLGEARSYHIDARQTMGAISSAAEECTRLLRRPDKASDDGKWLKAVQGCQTEAFAGTVELNRIAKRIRGR